MNCMKGSLNLGVLISFHTIETHVNIRLGYSLIQIQKVPTRCCTACLLNVFFFFLNPRQPSPQGQTIMPNNHTTAQMPLVSITLF